MATRIVVIGMAAAAVAAAMSIYVVVSVGGTTAPSTVSPKVAVPDAPPGEPEPAAAPATDEHLQPRRQPPPLPTMVSVVPRPATPASSDKQQLFSGLQPPKPPRLPEIKRALGVTADEDAAMDASFGAFRDRTQQAFKDMQRGKLSQVQFREALRTAQKETEKELEQTLGAERAKQYLEASDDDGKQLLGEEN